MRLKKKNNCLLEQFCDEGEIILKKGDELKIITKKGRVFEGILFDFKEGYLQTISTLGILIFFPLNSLSNIYQL